MPRLSRPVRVGIMANLGLLFAWPVGAQSPTTIPSNPPRQASTYASQAPMPPAGSTNAPVRVGVLIFAGIGPSIFHNSSGTGGSRTQSGDEVGRVFAAGGGVMLGFSGPVGATVTVRGGGGGGPRYVVTDTSRPGTSVELNLDDVRIVGVSIGAPVSIGRSFHVEPMLDFTTWKASDTTTVVVNQARSLTTVDRSGSDPGFGIRAAWFPSRRVGIGYEFHYVNLHDAAPAIAIGPGWVEESQSLVSMYFRWIH